METPKPLIRQSVISHTEQHPFGNDARSEVELLNAIYVGVIEAGLQAAENTARGGDNDEWLVMQERLSTLYVDTQALYERLGIPLPLMEDDDCDSEA